MANIVVWMKDGTKLDFPHEGRAGGSWTKTVRYEGSFTIITDEWGKETAIPSHDIKIVEKTPTRF